MIGVLLEPPMEIIKLPLAAGARRILPPERAKRAS